MKRILLLTALLGIASCGKDGTAPAPAIPTTTGHWSGVFSSSGIATTLTLTLQESSNSITGSGNLSSSTISLALTVTGTHADPSISLILAATGFQPINLTGSFATALTITATLNGSGYVGIPVTLTKS